jgi:hypothetical protein
MGGGGGVENDGVAGISDAFGGVVVVAVLASPLCCRALLRRRRSSRRAKMRAASSATPPTTPPTIAPTGLAERLGEAVAVGDAVVGTMIVRSPPVVVTTVCCVTVVRSPAELVVTNALSVKVEVRAGGAVVVAAVRLMLGVVVGVVASGSGIVLVTSLVRAINELGNAEATLSISDVVVVVIGSTLVAKLEGSFRVTLVKLDGIVVKRRVVRANEAEPAN